MSRSFHRIDLEGGIKLCISLRTMQKRKYNVEGSNSLWDIDKNHKLIRLVAICYFALQTEKQPERKQLDFGLF